MSKHLIIKRLKTRPAVYTIANSNTVIANLTPKYSSALAVKVEHPSSTWKFKYSFFRNNIAVKPMNPSNNEYIFKGNFFNSEGAIRLGRNLYSFKKTSFWKPKYVWVKDGTEIINYATKNFNNLKGEIQLPDQLSINEECLLLMTLGAYIIIDNLRSAGTS